MRLAAKILLLLVAVSSTCLTQHGCGGQVITLGPPPDGQMLDYSKTVRAWSRTKRLHKSLETHAVLHATYYSHEFVTAYLQEYRLVYDPVEAEMQSLIDKWTSRKVRQDCFFVSAYMGERDWNDLALSNSIWRIYLENDKGVRELPASVSEVEAKEQMLRHFYPYYADFFEAYEVCFDRYPKQSGGEAGLPHPILEGTTRAFTLSFRSPVGELNLEWVLAD